ncbi:MAG: hypothetical protein ACOC56_07130 [Atribacterota bacterium]
MDISKFLGQEVKYINFIEISDINSFFAKSIKGIFYREDLRLNLYTICSFLWLASFIFLFFVIFSDKNKFKGLNKNILVIALLIAISISLFIIFLLTKIYFIPVSLGLFGVNIAIVYWEITDRGANPEPFIRAVHFTLVTQMITANIGEIIYVSIYPLFKFSGGITKRDFVIFLWIIIAGSGLSVFMALISQFIWSGKRLTEKYN